MRLPKYRFTVRRLMITVAVVGMLLGLEYGRRRRATCLELATMHAGLEYRHRRIAGSTETQARRFRFRAEQIRITKRLRSELARNGIVTDDGANLDDTAALDAEATRSEFQALKELRDAEFQGRLRAKYEHAARTPWLPVEPDPADPG
jgi:hypothetical protein